MKIVKKRIEDDIKKSCPDIEDTDSENNNETDNDTNDEINNEYDADTE